MVLMNENEAAKFLTLKPATLRHWRINRKGPQFYRVGGAIRYSKSALEEFLKSSQEQAVDLHPKLTHLAG
jgi:hypothetical protein